MLRQLMLYFSFSGCFAHLENLNSLNREENDPFNYIQLAKIEDRSLTGHVIKTFLVLNDVECAFKCLLFNQTCTSFNYGGKNTNGFFVCELNNASHFSNPQNMTKKEGFVYAGIKWPFCVSSPCVNGGTCLETGTFLACTCPPSIHYLPYTDNRCNVDFGLIRKTATFSGVFGAEVGRYRLTFYEAKRLCEILGSTLTTYRQLYNAWETGMSHCAWSWNADAVVRFPMREAVEGCGEAVKIHAKNASKTERYNALCYKP